MTAFLASLRTFLAGKSNQQDYVSSDALLPEAYASTNTNELIHALAIFGNLTI